MGQAGFEEVGGLVADALMEENKLELLESVSGGTSDTDAEHVHIVFSEEISIENGIEIIKEQVLSGAEPDVRRIDDAGHAAVLVVSTAQRQQIENLGEVVRVKINEAADVLKKNSETGISDTTGSDVTVESQTDSAAAEALVVSAQEVEKESSATEHIVKEETVTEVTEAEEIGAAQAVKEPLDEAVTGAQTMATVVPSGMLISEERSGVSTGAIVAIVAAVCIAVVAALVLLRKKR